MSPAVLKDAEAEVTRLNDEVDASRLKGIPLRLKTKQRYLGSRLERLEVLNKRQQRIEQAEANLALVVSEQERLDQQIKLIRADAVATKNAETLTRASMPRSSISTKPINGSRNWTSSRI